MSTIISICSFDELGLDSSQLWSFWHLDATSTSVTTVEVASLLIEHHCRCFKIWCNGFRDCKFNPSEERTHPHPLDGIEPAHRVYICMHLHIYIYIYMYVYVHAHIHFNTLLYVQHIVSYHILPFHIILYYTILYYTILYYINLQCILVITLYDMIWHDMI